MPEVDPSIDARDLDRAARAELKTLSKDNAEQVARHLVAASRLLEDDPARAHEHALEAAHRAGRVAVVRETLAITAYETGDFALALRELRTYRRISGRDDQLPLMVDSERGVGRPEKALELGRSVDRESLETPVRVALAIAMSGARLDLGQVEDALSELEIPQLDPDRAFSWSPALFDAYAEVLEELGRTEVAAEWRARSARAVAALDAATADVETVTVFEVESDEETEEAPEAVVDAGTDGAAADEDAADGRVADDAEPEASAVDQETVGSDDEPAAPRED
ncbi:tetratricopeptide repeat protein [Agromyces sp. SYSU T00194]|uniref:tetratricopeptide repeat protein n=1 Tax=Agromyces chitinivorans TaxID=3158560 RepID=UPI003397D8C2